MNEPEFQTLSNTTAFTDKIRWLIFGRLALIFMLFMSSWWWTHNYLGLSTDFFPVSLFLLFTFSLFLTAVYLVCLYFNQDFVWQIRLQLFIDVLLVTFLVWGTGDVISPYITLYILLISVAGYFLENREALFAAILSAVCFTIVTILTSQSFIFSFSGEERSSRVVQITAFNNIAILIVGLLAARFSERRQVNQQLKETTESFADLSALHQRIVESIRSGLITTDLEGKIYTFNQAAEEISGLPANQIIGQSIFSIFDRDIHRPIDICLRAFPSNKFSTEHFEAEILSKSDNQASNAKNVTVACSVAPLIGKNDNVYGVILTFQDITQIKVMEETLRRSDRLAAVGRMAAGLAHEIRNPLGSMSSALQFLQPKVPAEEADLMDVVLRESDRLNKIINNFLSYARPKSDGFHGELQTVTNLNEAVRDCLMLLKHSPELNETHQFELEIPEKPVLIKANETQIKQILWNLLQNSIQAMPDGGNITIKLKEFSGRHVELVVHDTGDGIAPEYLKHLFEPFSDDARGTGLGLSIVHKIISEHGGRIDVQSKIGNGTKITVELPQK